jgi:NAD(P)-dependent dehydrogenase (short-subunit alcohol dehydrogenase family)
MAVSDFADRVILITGAASGIGRALARALAGLGARLVLADVAAEPLRTLAAELAAAGSRVWALPTDVTRAEQVERLAQTAFAQAGPVDGVVNCAGVYPVTPLFDITLEEWEQVLNTNLRGPFLVTQAVARRMVAQGIAGQIVNIGSTSSRVARPGIAHYGASKAGLNQLTAVLAIELAPHNIRVNAVLPGVIGTERVLSSTGTQAGEQEQRAKLAKIPQQRLGDPQEVVGVVLFLLSPAASYCTGAAFTVDGGFSLGMPGYR